MSDEETKRSIEQKIKELERLIKSQRMEYCPTHGVQYSAGESCWKCDDERRS